MYERFQFFWKEIKLRTLKELLILTDYDGLNYNNISLKFLFNFYQFNLFIMLFITMNDCPSNEERCCI